MADDAGALLVRAGLIADRALSAARNLQRTAGGTLGEHLVAGGSVSDEALTEFYRSRLMVPQVSPTTLAKLPDRVVELLPPDMAVEFRAVPVALDKDGNLTVAMSDPSDRHAVDEIGFFTGKYVVRAVATQMQIAWCLAHYYDYVTELGERLMQPAPVQSLLSRPSAGPAVKIAPAPAAAPASAAAAPAPIAKPAAAPVVAAPPAAAPIARVKGDTAKVDAARHRVLVPATVPPPIEPRPGPEALDRSGPLSSDTPEQVEIVIDADAPDPDAFAPEAPIAPAPATAKPAAPANPFSLLDPTSDPFADQRGAGASTVVVSPEATRPQRVRPAAPDPPELAARAGELQSHDARDRRVDAPSVTIEINLGEDEPSEDSEPIALQPKRPAAAAPPPVLLVVDDGNTSQPEALADGDGPGDAELAEPTQPGRMQPSVAGDHLETEPAIIVDTLPEMDSKPILLEHLRRGEPPPAEAPVEAAIQDEPSGPVLLLQRKKGVLPRRDKRTVIGLGALGPIPMSGEPPLAELRAPTEAPPAVRRPTTLSPPVPKEPARRAATEDDAVPSEVMGDEQVITRPVRPEERPSVDDGWGETTDGFVYGPPGTTIPPPFVGATEAIEDAPSGQIPISTGHGLALKGPAHEPLTMMPTGPTGPMSPSAMAAFAAVPTLVVPTHAGPLDVAFADDPTITTPAPAAATGAFGDMPTITGPAPAPARRSVFEAEPEPVSAAEPVLVAASGSEPVSDPVPVPMGESHTARGHAAPSAGALPSEGRVTAPTASPVDETRAHVAPPPPRQYARATTSPESAAMAKQLEEASLALVDLLRGLDQARTRDQVIALLLDFVATSHHRAAFLAVKASEMTAFMQSPAAPPGAAHAHLDLTQSSTFADVVGTRLPYRGPIGDEPSQGLVRAMFGSIADEMLAVPVAVRERVVGIVYADGRYRHSFDEHVTVGGRAAGIALERILKARRH